MRCIWRCEERRVKRVRGVEEVMGRPVRRGREVMRGCGGAVEGRGKSAEGGVEGEKVKRLRLKVRV